jgi:hypothetical protein
MAKVYAERLIRNHEQLQHICMQHIKKSFLV